MQASMLVRRRTFDRASLYAATLWLWSAHCFATFLITHAACNINMRHTSHNLRGLVCEVHPLPRDRSGCVRHSSGRRRYPTSGIRTVPEVLFVPVCVHSTLIGAGGEECPDYVGTAFPRRKVQRRSPAAHTQRLRQPCIVCGQELQSVTYPVLAFASNDALEARRELTAALWP